MNEPFVNRTSIKVVVADEHYFFRTGLRALLNHVAGIQIIDEVSTAQSALGAIQVHSPDVALVDAGLVEKNAALAQEMKHAQPHLHILLLHSAETHAVAEMAAEAGAFACLSKNASTEDMLQSIRNSTSAPARNVAPFVVTGDLPKAAVPKALTRREREVLDLVMRGYTSREIAHDLVLSAKTVEAHKFNLMRKLDVHNRADLIKLALRTQIYSYVQPSAKNRDTPARPELQFAL